MRLLFFHNVFCLGPFLALHDFKLNVIALLQAFVAVRLDGAVVDEHIGAVFPTDEAETLCVIEPFNFTFDSGHFLTPCVLGHCRLAVWSPWTVFILGCCHCLRRDAGHRRLPSPRYYVVYPLLWLCGYIVLRRRDGCQLLNIF